MRVYRSAPVRADYVWSDVIDATVHVPSLTVYEPHNDWRETGLVDASGNPLMSREEREPIGLVRFGNQTD